ncbi:MAG: trypsin-like peptidase domain-containing protein [Lachnospiraceae bacterium]|jgi:serine protease Do|nr:trypsin-like peptidase domain-containing protein [Lachnospiraceae bacterium]MCI1656218.1 trypsin-like peptidase domain-containing protein [Lachnospiraceae bacterium]MCI2194700.1 trypsin-like peptidase domain-containing protein [Lachnospiraceae bacterium]
MSDEMNRKNLTGADGQRVSGGTGASGADGRDGWMHQGDDSMFAEGPAQQPQSDSVYSYNYRDTDSASHAGDYDARRDSGNYSYESGDSGDFPGSGSGTEDSGRAYTGENNWRETRRTYERPKRKFGGGGGGRGRGRNGGGIRSPQSPGGRFGLNLLKCVAFAVVFGLIAGGIIHGMNPSGAGSIGSAELTEGSSGSASDGKNSSGSSAAGSNTDAAAVVKNVMPSIVSITTVSQSEYYDMFGQSEAYESKGSGSGILVSDDSENLYIATNNHVVEGARSLTVVFSDDQSVSGSVKGTDASSDLAVVTVKKSKMKKSTLSAIKTAVLGDSKSLKVGEPCIAIGNALGYGQSVTTGVISALNRQVSTQDSSTGETYSNTLLQTDAAINPGNSGGALLDYSGKVIGINSAKFSDTSVEGMGFAIPVSTARPIINNLIKGKSNVSNGNAYLGIVGSDVSESASSAYGIPKGIYITSVEKGQAAAAAGLQKGDIITSFNGADVTAMADLKSRLAACKPGDKVKVAYSRSDNGGYKSHTVTVTLGKKK